MPFFLKKRHIAIAAIVAFVLIYAVEIFVAFADDAVVPDASLSNALLAIGADTSGDGQISQDEIAALTGDLDLSNKGIADITGLEYAVLVNSINLQGNMVRDISKLLPLVEAAPPATPNLSIVDVSYNYLDISEGSDDRAVIDQLIAAGCTVTYDPQTPIPVESLTLSADTLLLGIGETSALTATVTPDDAANKNVIWTSSDSGIVTLDNGSVTGVAAGQATITASSEQDPNFTGTCEITVKSYQIESTTYPIDRSLGIIKSVPKMTSSTDFLSHLRNDVSDLAIYDTAGNLCAETTMKTGMSVKLNIGGTERDSLVVAVSGDGNGDGMISVSDYTLTRLDILGLKNLIDVYRAACDVNGDGKISISDYTTIRLDILGVKTINALPDLPEVSDPRIRAFLDVALMQQGKPYVWGTEGPDSFDCSGYVYYCLKQVGYIVGRTTANNYSNNENWQYVPRDQLQPGDLMFYFSDNTPGVIGHIGIYLGNGYHIHASSDYGCVIICRIEGWYDRMLSHGRRVFY